MNHSYDIEQLLQQKSFDELNNSERSFVLSFMTSERYTEMRHLILKVGQDLPSSTLDIQPRPQTYLKLRQYLLAERPTVQTNTSWAKNPSFLSLLQTRIPLYKVAASILLLGIALFTILPSLTSSSTHSLNPSVSPSHKIISPFTENETSNHVPQSFNPNPSHQLVSPSRNVIKSHFSSTKRGITHQEDSVLMHLLIEAH